MKASHEKGFSFLIFRRHENLVLRTKMAFPENYNVPCPGSTRQTYAFRTRHYPNIRSVYVAAVVYRCEHLGRPLHASSETQHTTASRNAGDVEASPLDFGFGMLHQLC